MLSPEKGMQGPQVTYVTSNLSHYFKLFMSSYLAIYVDIIA